MLSFGRSNQSLIIFRRVTAITDPISSFSCSCSILVRRFSGKQSLEMPSSKDKYTDPKLRDEVKEDIQESDKGGAPRQWSARKVCDDLILRSVMRRLTRSSRLK